MRSLMKTRDTTSLKTASGNAKRHEHSWTELEGSQKAKEKFKIDF